MPLLRTRRRRVVKKRPMQRKRKFGGRKMRLKRSMTNSLPEHLTTKLSYAIGQIGSTTTTTPGGKIFYVNNIYDLFTNLTYSQPRYFDQLAAMYNRYRVNAVGYEFECAPLTGSSYFAHGFFPHDYSIPVDNLKAYQEDRRFKISLASLNRGPIKIKGFKTIGAIEDVPKRVIHDDDGYNAETNQSVTYRPQLRIQWQALDETQAYGHWITGRITFFTTFYQLKMPAAS